MGGPDRAAGLRATGLAGTVLMAAGAFGAGALPGADPDAGLRTAGWTAPGTYWAGLAAWLAGLVLLAVAWWRLGRWRSASGDRAPVRWLLVTGLLWALPLLVAPPAASRDVYAYACQGAIWLDGADPYAVGVGAGGCPWVDAVPLLWRETPTPYGPLAVVLSGGAAALARSLPVSEGGQLLAAVGLLRLVALAGGLLVAAALPRLARACGVEPAVAVWLGLVSPLTAIHVAAGAHNDALMVGLVAAALALVADPARRPVLPAAAAGALLGLAAAVKVTALVAVPFVVLLAALRLRSGHRGLPAADLVRAALVVGTVGVAVFAGLTAATGLDLGWIGGLSGTGRLVQWTSLPTGVGMAVGYLLRVAGRPEAFDAAVTVARGIGLAALVVVAAALVAGAARCAAGPAAREPRGRATGPAARAPRGVVAACGAAFAAVAVLSPVFYPWYALAAIVVLAAALTDPRWRDRLAVAALVLCFLVLPDGLGVAVLTKLPGALLDAIVVAALLAIGARRLWAVRSPGPGPAA